MVRTPAIWLLIFFALLFILGLNSGEVKTLLNTGITICLSCIGIG
ncbi:MAG: CD1871A family CXXC motif-containing protein [Desulfobacteraceae bacterium]